jgi:hypothetical protein
LIQRGQPDRQELAQSWRRASRSWRMRRATPRVRGTDHQRKRLAGTSNQAHMSVARGGPTDARGGGARSTPLAGSASPARISWISCGSSTVASSAGARTVPRCRPTSRSTGQLAGIRSPRPVNVNHYTAGDRQRADIGRDSSRRGVPRVSSD